MSEKKDVLKKPKKVKIPKIEPKPIGRATTTKVLINKLTVKRNP